MKAASVTLSDLQVDNARASYRTLGNTIESLAYTPPEDTAKLNLCLATAARCMNEIATALCLIKPEKEQS